MINRELIAGDYLTHSAAPRNGLPTTPPLPSAMASMLSTAKAGLAAGTLGVGVTLADRWALGNRYTDKLTIAGVFSAIAGGGNLAVGLLVYTLPAGHYLIKNAYMSIACAGAAAIRADTPDLGIGTVIGSGAVAVLGGTATFENILTGVAMANCNGTAKVYSNTVNLEILAGAAHTIHLNIADGWAAGGDAALDVSGTIILDYIKFA